MKLHKYATAAVQWIVHTWQQQWHHYDLFHWNEVPFLLHQCNRHFGHFPGCCLWPEPAICTKTCAVFSHMQLATSTHDLSSNSALWKCSTTPKNPISQPDTSNPKHMTQQQDSLVDYATLSTNASVQLRQCRQTQFPVLLQVTSLYTLGFSYMLQLPEPPKEKRLQTDILNQLPKYLSKNHTNVRCC